MKKSTTLTAVKKNASLTILVGSLLGGVSAAQAATIGQAESIGTGSAIRTRALQVSSAQPIALEKDSTEGKCGEGKCGEKKPDDKTTESNCGDGHGDSSSGH